MVQPFCFRRLETSAPIRLAIQERFVDRLHLRLSSFENGGSPKGFVLGTIMQTVEAQ